MFYDFPIIEHLDQVMSAISDSPEFIVADRGDYKVVNYMVSKEDTFPSMKVSGGSAKMRNHKLLMNAIRRECRGLKFYSDGRIAARPFHKWFNVGERDETSPDSIELNHKHHVMAKLDGSMIHPLIINDTIYYATKMGVTEFSYDVAEWVSVNPNYEKFVRYLSKSGHTPIFEWCSLKNRVVVEYKEPRLVLLAIRHTITGQYLTYEHLKDYAETFGIDLVKTYDSADSIMDLMERGRALEGEEGYVLAFENGHRLKIKSDWYVRIHKSKELFAHQRHLANLVLTETADDAKAIMLEEDRKRFEEFENQFVTTLEDVADQVYTRLKSFGEPTNEARKNFAINEAKRWGIFASVVFKHFEEAGSVEMQDVFASVESVVAGYTTNNTKYEKFEEELEKFWNNANNGG